MLRHCRGVGQGGMVGGRVGFRWEGARMNVVPMLSISIS